MDFMHDQLRDGRTLKLFNLIDNFNREATGKEIDFSLSLERVIRELKQIISWRGKPEVIRYDKGLNTLVPQHRHGHKSGESSWNIFNLESRNKTLV